MTRREAIEILEGVDRTTVIDDNWNGYLKEQPKVLEALCFLTYRDNYEEILEEYEGYTIRDLLIFYE